MSKVLVVVPGLGVLALEPEAYRTALDEGARLAAPIGSVTPSTDEPLIDAAELASKLSLPVTWIEERTRRDELPCIRAGRWIRYNRRAVEAALSVNGKGTRALHQLGESIPAHESHI